MQNTKRFILAGCLATSVITALTGCGSEDRSTGQWMDDRRTASHVESTLNHDPVFKFDDVHVSVYSGVAQLSGFVDTQAQVRAAGERAARAEGVRQVINDIALRPQFKLVPAGQQAGAAGMTSSGGTGAGYGEGYGNWQEPQHAPIVTPNQGSPATPNTSGK